MKAVSLIEDNLVFPLFTCFPLRWVPLHSTHPIVLKKDYCLLIYFVVNHFEDDAHAKA